VHLIGLGLVMAVVVLTPSTSSVGGLLMQRAASDGARPASPWC
jgi:hypothetical protein